MNCINVVICITWNTIGYIPRTCVITSKCVIININSFIAPQIFLSPRDKETPEYLSNVLGKQTILLKQKSGKNSILPWDQDSITWIEKERPLLMASETITQLANESVVIIESLTIRSPKNKWFICPDMISKIEKGKLLNKTGNIGYRDTI